MRQSQHILQSFGMGMFGRSSGNEYAFGNNGQRAENELFEGAFSAEFWMYDSRLGRRWERDPLVYKWQSPYACFNNNPIYFSDPLGLEGGPAKETPKFEGFESQGGKGTETNPLDLNTVDIIVNKKDIVIKKGLDNKPLTIPRSAQVQYDSKYKYVYSFKYSYKDEHTNKQIIRNFVAQTDGDNKFKGYMNTQTDYPGDDNSLYYYTSNQHFDNEADAYTFMWNMTETSHTEQIAYVTESGVYVSTNAFSDCCSSYNTGLTTTTDDEIYINGERVLAEVHTHPRINFSKDFDQDGGSSDGDRYAAQGLLGVPEIHLAWDNTVGGDYWKPGDKGYNVLSLPKGTTKSNLMSGKSKLVPFLKQHAKSLKK